MRDSTNPISPTTTALHGKQAQVRRAYPWAVMGHDDGRTDEERDYDLQVQLDSEWFEVLSSELGVTEDA